MNKERTEQYSIDTGSQIQSADEYFADHERRNAFGNTFTLDQGHVFQIATDEKWLIDLTSLMTIKSWKEGCREAEIDRVWEEGSVARCGDGVLQVSTDPDGWEVINFLEWEDKRIDQWEKILGEKLVAEDAFLRWKISGIKGYVLNQENLPTHIISAFYIESGINVSIKELTETWVSTIFVHTIHEDSHWTSSALNNSIWFGSTDNGSVFFESNSQMIPTNFTLKEGTRIFAWVVTNAIWTWIDNITIE